MVSGSSVGNTVTTGSVTIPMMKKTGYKPEFAGAVEAASSTGGQIMPPIMGAAAFLMAEYIGVPYGQVALWAILPAVLYFTGIFISVHLEAKKLGLLGIPREPAPQVFAAPAQRLPAHPPGGAGVAGVGQHPLAAVLRLLAIVIAIAVSLPGAVLAARKTCPNGASAAAEAGRRTASMIVNSLEAGGRGCITVAVACSMAGMIAGCITATGLASKLVSAIVSVSKAIPNKSAALLIALFLTMLCCIVLGMGVPTTANYCIMASTCAPSSSRWASTRWRRTSSCSTSVSWRTSPRRWRWRPTPAPPSPSRIP
jgi:TRAP transporter 4TM/12TM fusion protein